MGVTIDVSEVLALGADLAAAGAKVADGMRPIVSKGALAVKTQMASEMSGSGSFGHVAPTISYDLRGNAVFSEAEIGPTKPRGALAAIAYFGGSYGGGATVPDPEGAMNAEVPNLERAFGDLLEGLL